MTDPIRDRLVALLHRAATESGDYGTSPTNVDTWGCVCGIWGGVAESVEHEHGCPVAAALQLLTTRTAAPRAGTRHSSPH